MNFKACYEHASTPESRVCKKGGNVVRARCILYNLVYYCIVSKIYAILGTARPYSPSVHRARLSRTSRPKPTMTRPEARLTQRRPPGVNQQRNRLTQPLRMSHHRAEPTKTPRTSVAAEPKLPVLM